MLGTNQPPIPKDRRLRLIRIGDLWVPNGQLEAAMPAVLALKPEREKMTKIGALTDYLRDKVKAALDSVNPLHAPAPARQLGLAVAQAKAALVGDSNDAEHDALAALVKALGEGPVPDCDCPFDADGLDRHEDSCPSKAWEK